MVAFLLDRGLEGIQGLEADTEAEGGGTSLHMAAQGGHFSVVKTLLNHGASLHARTDAMQTPLHKAAYEGHGPCVRLLLGGGADINAQDKEGHGVLHHAAAGGRHAIVDLLCANPELDVFQEDGKGEDAAIMAAKNGFKDLASRISRTMYVQMRRQRIIQAMSAAPSDRQ